MQIYANDPPTLGPAPILLPPPWKWDPPTLRNGFFFYFRLSSLFALSLSLSACDLKGYSSKQKKIEDGK